jgi:hypothetical protein
MGGACNAHGEMRNAYENFSHKPEGKSPRRTSRRRWEDNIEIDLKEIGSEGVDWIQLAQGEIRKQDVVKTATSPRIP